MKLRWCMLLVGILCLAMLPALAASPDWAPCAISRPRPLPLNSPKPPSPATG